jgi:hypothetical protein
MSLSQIINVKTSGDRPIILSPGIKYQILIDSFGTVVFVNLNTGNYLQDTLKEV